MLHSNTVSNGVYALLSSHRDYTYFWVPVVGPHIGAIVGAFIYQLCVGLHWPDEQQEMTSDVKNIRKSREMVSVDAEDRGKDELAN